MPTMSAGWLELLRLGVGAGLSLCPIRVAGRAQGRAATPEAVLFTRLLGLRHLVQGVAGLAAPGLFTPARGAVIDAVHAATMLPLVVGHQHRRAAALNIVAAAGFAGLGLAASHRGVPARPGPPPMVSRFDEADAS